MPVDGAGLFSFMIVSWITRLMWKAYKKGLKWEDIPLCSKYEMCEYNTDRYVFIPVYVCVFASGDWMILEWVWGTCGVFSFITFIFEHTVLFCASVMDSELLHTLHFCKFSDWRNCGQRNCSGKGRMRPLWIMSCGDFAEPASCLGSPSTSSCHFWVS